MFFIIFLLFSISYIQASPNYLVHVRPTSPESFQYLKTLNHPDLYRSYSPGVWTTHLNVAQTLPNVTIQMMIEETDRIMLSRNLVSRNGTDPFLGYTTHEDLIRSLHSIANVRTDIARFVHIGYSEEGREIAGIFFAKGNRRNKPTFAYMGPVHGDEVVGREAAKKLAEYIVHGSPNNLLDHVDLLIVPTLNPDGYQSITRRNSKDHDLNRSFPKRCSDWTGGDLDAEVRAAMWIIETFNPDGIGWFHGGTEILCWPFDDLCDHDDKTYHAPSPGPETRIHEEMSKVYSDLNPRTKLIIPAGGINCADWYFLEGGAADWALYHGNQTVVSMTMELSSTKFPTIGDFIQTYWASIRPGLLEFPKKLNQGLFGTLKGPRGEIVAGKIWVLDGHTNALPIPGRHKLIPTRPDGSFRRPLAVGKTTVIIAAEGYVGTRIQVDIKDMERIDRDIVLYKMPNEQRNHPDKGTKDTPYVE
jgi:hypothetical protein